MIHLGHDSRFDEQIVDRVVTLLESTSPSSLLVALARRGAPDGGRPRLRS